MYKKYKLYSYMYSVPRHSTLVAGTVHVAHSKLKFYLQQSLSPPNDDYKCNQRCDQTVKQFLD